MLPDCHDCSYTKEHVGITRAVFLRVIYPHYKANLSKKRKEKLQENLVCLGSETLTVIVTSFFSFVLIINMTFLIMLTGTSD